MSSYISQNPHLAASEKRHEIVDFRYGIYVYCKWRESNSDKKVAAAEFFTALSLSASFLVAVLNRGQVRPLVKKWVGYVL